MKIIIPCVYKIENLINKKIYIGSTINFEKRKKLHIVQLTNGVHHSKHLQNAWNFYGPNNFVFTILEKLTDFNKDILLEREQYYLDLLKPWEFDKGYNNCLIAGSRLEVKCTDDTKQKNRLVQLGRTHSNEVRKKISINNSGVLNHQFGKQIPLEQRIKIIESCKNRPDIIRKSIYQYEKNLIFIKQWNSITEASKELKIDKGNISLCCKKNLSGKNYSYKNFIWSFNKII